MSDYDTQPTIKTVLERMDKGFAAIAEEFGIVHATLAEIRADLKKLSKKFDELGHDTYDLRGRVAVLEDQHDSK